MKIYICAQLALVTALGFSVTALVAGDKSDPENIKRHEAAWRCDPRAYSDGIAGVPSDCSGHIDLSRKPHSSQAPTEASAPTGEKPQPAQSDPSNDQVKKALGNLLKGFGW